MNTQHKLWSQIVNNTAKDGVLYQAMHQAAGILSQMVNRPLDVKEISIKTLAISQMMVYGPDPEAETIGVYLRISNDLPGEALLILTPVNANHLADWLLELPSGTTTVLDDMARSALAEFGNIALASFLNAIADLTNTPVTPLPPKVRIDMLATLLEAAITLLGEPVDELLIVETEFINVQSQVQIQFWLLPNSAAVNAPKI